MKSLKNHLPVGGLIVIIFISMLFTSCGFSSLSGYVVHEENGKIILTSDKRKTVIASGKLVYAEGDNKSKDNIYLLWTNNGLHLTNIQLPPGKTNTIQIDSQDTMDMLISRYPTNGETWLVLPSRSMALLISNDGQPLFNTKQFLPDHEVPYCDCSSVAPIITTDKYDWVELIGQDDVMFIAVDKEGTVKHKIQINKPEGIDIRWSLLGENILIATGSGDGNIWQYYLYSPDGSLIWSTDNIKDYIGGLWEPAGSGSPEYAIYGDKMATLYQDKDENIHLLVIDSKGKTLFNNPLPIEGGRKSLGMLQWIDRERITLTDGEITIFLVNIDKGIVKKTYALSPLNILTMKNLMVVDGYYKRQHHFLIINTQTGTVSDLNFLIQKEAGMGSYIYKIVPLSQRCMLLWVKTKDNYDNMYALKDDGTLFLLSVEGDTIYNFEPVPYGNDKYAEVYAITTYGSKNPNTFYLYHIDNKGLPHPILKNIPGKIDISTYPTPVWHYTTDKGEFYEDTNHQILVKDNTIVVEKGKNLSGIVPYTSDRYSSLTIFIITPKRVQRFELPDSHPYFQYIQKSQSITGLLINYSKWQEDKVMFLFIGKR